jgi:hypothetical protein
MKVKSHVKAGLNPQPEPPGKIAIRVTPIRLLPPGPC